MRVAYLAFLSFAVTALCAPSSHPVGQDAAGSDGEAGPTAFEATHKIKALGLGVAGRADEGTTDACTDCGAEPGVMSVVSKPTLTMVLVPSPTVNPSVLPSAPAQPNRAVAGPGADSSSDGSSPSISDLYSHFLSTIGRSLTLSEAVLNTFAPKAEQAASSGTDGDAGDLARRASAPQYEGETPTIRELFSQSMRISGRALDGVDRMLTGAHDVVTGATPLSARDSAVPDFGDALREFFFMGMKVVEMLGEAFVQVASQAASEGGQN